MTPITQEQYWKTVCDECGEAFPESDLGGYELSDTEKEARERVLELDGEITDEGRIICATCVEGREEEDRSHG